MIFNEPAITSGHPNGERVNSHPAIAGLSEAVRLRGTAVRLEAAGRSSGPTTAMTYELRTGTSICESRLLRIRNPRVIPRSGARAAAIRKRLAGRCVNTIVGINPKRLAMRAATRYEKAEHRPVAKKIDPVVLAERPKR